MIRATNIFIYTLLGGLAFFISLSFPQNPIDSYYFGDSAIYEYFGKMMNEGYLPYRDIFDHKGPITYFWYALAYKIYPMYGAWFLETLILLLSLCLSFHMAKIYFAPWISFSLICLLYLNTPAFDTIGNSENMALLFLLYITYVTEKYLRTQTFTKKECFYIGITCAVLLLIKPTFLAIPFIFGLYIFANLLCNKSYNLLRTLLHLASIGFLIPVIILSLWLYRNNLFSDFYNIYINFNINYTQNYANSHTFLHTLSGFLKMPSLILAQICIVFIAIQFKTYSKQERKLLTLILTAFIFALIINVLPRNIHLHYMFTLFPLILYLLIFAVQSIKKEDILYALLEISILVSAYNFHKSNTQQHLKFVLGDKEIREIAEVLKKELQPNETFSSLIFDTCALYLYSDRNSATQFPQVFSTYKVIPDEVKKEFAEKKPQVLVASRKKSIYKKIINIKDYKKIGQTYSYSIYRLKEQTQP